MKGFIAELAHRCCYYFFFWLFNWFLKGQTVHVYSSQFMFYFEAYSIWNNKTLVLGSELHAYTSMFHYYINNDSDVIVIQWYRWDVTRGILLVCSSGCFIRGIGLPLVGTSWFLAFRLFFTPCWGLYFLRGIRLPSQNHNRFLYLYRTCIISSQPSWILSASSFLFFLFFFQ